MIRHAACIKLLTILALLVVFPVRAHDKQEIITMEADQVQYEHKKGTITYNGHVHGKQGVTDLIADQMIVYYDEHHKIKKVTAIGKLAQYKTQLEENKGVLTASARTIHYFPLAGKVRLEQDAIVIFNKNTFTGPLLTYDLITKTISSFPKNNYQSKIILEPIKQLKADLK